MMDCKHIDELLVEYLYQELDPSQVESFEAHLQSCPRCAQELASYERTRAIVQEMPEVEPPPRIDERILAEAARAAHGRPSSPTEEPGLWQRIVEGLRMLVMHPAMTAAVTLVLVLGVSFYVYRSSSPRSVREELDTPYSPEVDRRLPSGSATISVREQASEQQEKRLEGEKDRVGAQVQAPLAVKQEERALANGIAKAELRAKSANRVVTRRAKEKATEDEPGLRPGGRRGPAETANVLGKAGAGQGGSVSPTPAAATPAADPMATIGKSGKLAQAAAAPKADEAPTRASKSRESADKNEGFAQKKTPADILDGALLAKGGAKTSSAPPAPKTALKRAVAPRKEAPRAKPTPIAAEARPAKSRGKGWSGKGSSMNDDLDSVGDESKAAYKGQLASKLKAPTSALAARAVEDGDKARSAGRCDQALAHYNRAISLDQKQLPMLAGKVRACAAELAKKSDLPLFKAAKSYPALAGLLAPELERARRARTERAAKDAQQTQVRGPRKAVKAKAAKPTKVDAYESAK